MHLVIFGLGMSSSWGNGHATLWRGLVRALARRGHTIVFYEKDVPYYASTRDGWEPPLRARLRLYDNFGEIRSEVERELDVADIALSTSYCADGVLSFLLFPVEHPEFFDAVATDANNVVKEIAVKGHGAASSWVWGAIKMPGSVFHALHRLWQKPERRDEYFGTHWSTRGSRRAATPWEFGPACSMSMWERCMDIAQPSGCWKVRTMLRPLQLHVEKGWHHDKPGN